MVEYKGKLKREFIDKALRYLIQYKADKEGLKQRIIENQKWYTASYAKILDSEANTTRPASSYIFSAIESKYADAVDNFPVPNLIEREENDEELALLLSKIIPAEFDMAGFKRTYKDNARRKLRYGTAIYGVFYNPDKDAIDITAVDILNIYCDMHLKNIQDSQFVFVVSCIDNDFLKEEYPKFSELFEGDAQVEGYNGGYTLEDKTEVIDCYYKKIDGTVHLMKIVGDTVIDATEDTQGYENGLYSHGEYPIILDVMYPETDCPFGYSVIDIVKNVQEYIDILDGAIIKNALLQAETKYIYKENSGINEKDLLDAKKAVVKASGDISEDALRQFTYQPIAEHTLSHRETKKNELKEIIGNRDFQQGGTTGGVTAASAITALQSAGEKLSRAMCDDSYDAFKDVVRQAIELIREFYETERVYRIINEKGQKEFKKFDNSSMLKLSDDTKYDGLGFPINPKYKKVEFDIEITPQRENPFNRESVNQTMMTLWNSGVLIPDNVKSGASSIILQAMSFDGKEKLLSLVEGYKDEIEKQEQQAMQAQQTPQMSGGEQLPMGEGDELVPIDLSTGQIAEGQDDEELIPVDLNNLQGGELNA